jgi:hypothetical protein
MTVNASQQLEKGDKGIMLLLCAAPIAMAQSGQDLYQQGLAKEQIEGDITGAIQIYQRIVRDFAAHKPLAAKTLVQLGGAYEKLGQVLRSSTTNKFSASIPIRPRWPLKPGGGWLC